MAVLTVSISGVQEIQLAPFERSGRAVNSLWNSWLNSLDVTRVLDVVEGSIATMVTSITASDGRGQSNSSGNAGDYAGGPHTDGLSFSVRLNGQFCRGDAAKEDKRKKHPKNYLGTGPRQYKASAVLGSDRPASPGTPPEVTASRTH